MHEIRTHYENLKISRHAPPEVIKAAYRALAQKYHPDRNPGDGEAARITALLNQSYAVLMDPAQRCEHDRWIDAIEQLQAVPSRGEEPVAMRGPRLPWRNAVLRAAHRLARSTAFRVALSAALVTSLVLVVVLKRIRDEPRLPEALWSARMATQNADLPRPLVIERNDARTREAASLLGAPILLGDPSATEADTPADTRCESVPPASYSGYLPQLPQGNQDGDSELVVDNTTNTRDAIVKLVDLEQAVTVRTFQVKANATFTVRQLAGGRYRLLYRHKGSECRPYTIGDAFLVNGERGAPARPVAWMALRNEEAPAVSVETR